MDPLSDTMLAMFLGPRTNPTPRREKDGRVFYHGSHGGLSVGALLLPPRLTGGAGVPRETGNFSDTARLDCVFVTTRLAVAMSYACAFDDATVYEVRPVGRLRCDPNFTPRAGVGRDEVLMCRRARITDARAVNRDFVRVFRARVEAHRMLMTGYHAPYIHWKPTNIVRGADA